MTAGPEERQVAGLPWSLIGVPPAARRRPCRCARRRPAAGWPVTLADRPRPATRRPVAQQLVDVVDAEGDEQPVDHHVDDQRDQHVAGRQRGRDRILGAQQAVDDPGLAPDLGGVPAGQDGDEAGRERQERAPTETSATISSLPRQRRKLPNHETASMTQSHADHEAEGEERDHAPAAGLRAGTIRARLSARVKLPEAMKLPSFGTEMA